MDSSENNTAKRKDFQKHAFGRVFFALPRYGLRRSYILAVAKTKVFIRLHFDNNVKGTMICAKGTHNILWFFSKTDHNLLLLFIKIC